MSDPDLTGLDPHARRFMTMMSLGAGDAGTVTAEARRASFVKLMRFSKAPDGEVSFEDRVIATRGVAIPARLYSVAKASDRKPGLIYFHGGGLVAGSIETHDALCRTLAHHSACRIVSVGYRLAPEHPFPTPIVDALLATRAITNDPKAFGLVRGHIAVGGDSGGGTLAAIVARVLRQRLRAQILLCPVLDFGGPQASRQSFAKGFLLDDATLARDLDDYAPTRALSDPAISPLRAASFEGLPKAIIHTAGFDPLRDEGAVYAARLREAGIGVELTCHASLIHHFYGLTGIIPAVGPVLADIGRDIARVLG